jgi:hypothetical protein
MEGIDTTKSRALRIDLLHRQIEEEMQGEINDLKIENQALQDEKGNVLSDRDDFFINPPSSSEAYRAGNFAKKILYAFSSRFFNLSFLTVALIFEKSCK